MCGIAGLFDPKEAQRFDPAVIRRMTAALAHRGPDGDGFYDGDGVTLGHRRLSIIDLAGGAQPMYAADGAAVVIFNGEIYNFQDLTRELTSLGFVFRTRSDTEAILHAWRQWGERCVERLHGQFAIALWDERQQTLFLARDRLGKKPLYYSVADGRHLAFASEIKALRQWPRFHGRLDASAIEDYLCYGYVPDPKSIFADIRKLPPAHTLTWTRGGTLRLREYWTLDLVAAVAPTRSAAAHELIDRLDAAVRQRMISDVPLGAFLSGGVDSSAIVAAMARANAGPVRTFTIGFKGAAQDETAYARQMAERYQTEHTEEIIEAGMTDGGSPFDRVVDVYDEPFGDNSAIPTLRVCAAARKRVTVALSGDGGDEAFAGYRRYLWHTREQAVRGFIPPAIRGPFFRGLAAAYPKLDWAPRMFRAKATLQELSLDAADAFCSSVSPFDAATRRSLYTDAFAADLQGYRAESVMRSWMSACGDDRPLIQAQYADAKTWLAGRMLVKVDRASMAHSLEVRNPFLDHDLFQWALSLPAELKLSGREYKAILKSALEPYVPHDLLYRPKQGFDMPIAGWLRGPWRDEARRALTGSAIADTGILRPERLTTLLDEHVAGRRDHAAPLWSLLVLERFLARL